MRGSDLPGLRSRVCAAALLASAVVLLPATAAADTTPVPAILDSTAVNTSRVDVSVPTGVEPTAITGVLSMPEVVPGGVVVFRVNGRVAETIESALFQQVEIPVTPADVIADGTMALSIEALGPVTGDCRPPMGEATLRNVLLDYDGEETAPTSLATFFPPDAARIDVVVPADASDEQLEAGLVAVASLAGRYDDGTLVVLGTAPVPPEDGTAAHRVVVVAEGRPGEVTAEITAVADVPTLTMSGTGDALVDAARALGSAGLDLSGSEDTENLSQQLKPRSPTTSLNLEELGANFLSLAGYGTTSQTLEIPQDAFGGPVSALDIHLEGSHTAVEQVDRARLDVRVNDALVGSTVLGTSGEIDLDVHVPSGRLGSVNELALTLRSLAPDGAACVGPGAPTVEVDINVADSGVRARRGSGSTTGFQMYPQVFEGTLPVAIRGTGVRRLESAADAAALVAALQRAAASPLDVQLTDPDNFLADDRSGLLVGATTDDSIELQAPLRLSATRLVETPEATFEVTSQSPYAVLESVAQSGRSVLMLGSWAPGNDQAAPALSNKVVAEVTDTGWAALEGDLVLADASSDAFVADTGTPPEQTETDDERSYVIWFVAVIALVLLLVAFQVAVSVRRDRTQARTEAGDEVAEPEEPDALMDEAVDQDESGAAEENDEQSVEPTSEARPVRRRRPPGRP